MRDKQVTVINLTRSTLNFISKEGHFITLKPKAEVKIEILRVEQDIDAMTEDGMSSIKLNETRIGKIKNLPEYKEGFVYIVPTLVYQSCYHYRPDVYVVDEPVKDSGNIRTSKALSRPTLMSVKSDYDKIRNLISKIDFDNKESIVDTFYKVKTIVDVYS